MWVEIEWTNHSPSFALYRTVQVHFLESLTDLWDWQTNKQYKTIESINAVAILINRTIRQL